MTKPLTLHLAQLNPVVGDIQGNLALARAELVRAARAGADLVVLPELFLMAYPPEDLVMKPSAVTLCQTAVETLAADTRPGGPGVLVGTPWRGRSGKLHNSALLVEGGEIRFRWDKRELPNYGVFDEVRLFEPGEGPPRTVDFRGVRIGIAVCEDIWFSRVPEALKAAGAHLMVVPNGSPWRRTSQAERARAFAQWGGLGLPYVWVNQVGGQDELVFDGASFCVDGDGTRHQLLGDFETGHAQVQFDPGPGRFTVPGWPAGGEPTLTRGLEAEYRAACLALGDYVGKNRFPGVLLGLSGGIDSALTAAIAVDALGPERVWCVMMPSRYTSPESLEDARACAEALGVRYDTVAIGPGVAAFDEMLDHLFAGRAPDLTEENLQSRLRGVTLMALSNKFGHMVVTTGNKSEMAVGYATLYGDMCGGYNPLKDFYKTEVFALARWRNGVVPRGALGPAGEVIPERILTKPPTAELREDQKDEDSLPSYPVLDDILRGLVDGEEDLDDIVARGHDEAVVRRIEHLLYVAEYKRRQAAPGVKIGPRNFGRDRRYPITNRFRDD